MKKVLFVFVIGVFLVLSLMSGVSALNFNYNVTFNVPWTYSCTVTNPYIYQSYSTSSSYHVYCHWGGSDCSTLCSSVAYAGGACEPHGVPQGCYCSCTCSLDDNPSEHCNIIRTLYSGCGTITTACGSQQRICGGGQVTSVVSFGTNSTNISDSGSASLGQNFTKTYSIRVSDLPGPNCDYSFVGSYATIIDNSPYIATTATAGNKYLNINGYGGSGYYIDVNVTGVFTPGALPVMASAKFQNMGGPAPHDISQAQKNDTVALILDGDNLEGWEFNFTVYEQGKTQPIFTTKIPAQSSTRAYAFWKINASGWENSLFGIPLPGYVNSRQFKFNVTAVDLGQSKISEILTVDYDEDNTAPVALISSPTSDKYYNITDVINFTSASYDIDDPIVQAWDFGDGTFFGSANKTWTTTQDFPMTLPSSLNNSDNELKLSFFTIACSTFTSHDTCLLNPDCHWAYVSGPCVGTAKKYFSSSGYNSSIWDTGSLLLGGKWGLLFSADTPPNTNIIFQTQTSNNTVDWTAWQDLDSNNQIQSPVGRYIKWKATFSTSDTSLTPVLRDISLLFNYPDSNPITTHTYASCDNPNLLPGCIANVTLGVIDSRGVSNSTSMLLYLNDSLNQPPVVVISEPTQNQVFHIRPNANITFNASKTFDDNDSIDNLNFTWAFDNEATTFGGIGNSTIKRSFDKAGNHNVTLKVTDKGFNSSTATVNFTISGCGATVVGECFSGESYICNTSEQKEQRADLCDHCSSGTYSNGPKCSPPGNCKAPGLTSSTCNGEVGCFWLKADSSHCEYCNASDVSPKACKDYKDIDSCTNDRCDIGKTGIGSGICGKTSGGYKISIQSCMCKWNEAAKNCSFVYTRTNTSTQAPEDCIATITTTEKETVTEVLTELNCSNTITNSTEIIHKPGALPIPFFTFWNMVIAIGAVAAAYIVINNLKKKPKVRKRRK